MSKPLKIGVLILAIAVLTTAGLVYLRGTVPSRVQALFDNLVEAVEEGPARDIIACCDSDYDFYAHWPVLRNLAATVEDGDDNGHAVALQVMKGYFVRTLRKENQRTFTYEIIDIQPVSGSDTDYRVEARIGYTISGGVTLGKVDPPVTVEFILRQSGGIFPTMRFLSHDRIRYSR